MITRRSFIEVFGLTAVAGIALNSPGKTFGQSRQSGDLFRIPPASMADPLFSFTSAHFTPFLNTDFQLQRADSRRTQSLRLIDVKVFQRKENLAKGAVGESFSLMFRGSLPANLSGESFELSHPSLGLFTLFLASVNKEPDRYEAIINHLQG